MIIAIRDVQHIILSCQNTLYTIHDVFNQLILILHYAIKTKLNYWLNCSHNRYIDTFSQFKGEVLKKVSR